MTADLQTARAAAQLREAAEDLARLACDARPGGTDRIGAWAELARDLADRYYVHVDGLDARRALRYVAIARNLHVRPYAVVTRDPDEMRQALAHEISVPGPGWNAREPEAMRRQEVMAQLRYHWGDVYQFTIADGRYRAAARFGQREMLDAEDPRELLGKVRRHYRRDLPQERCST